MHTGIHSGIVLQSALFIFYLMLSVLCNFKQTSLKLENTTKKLKALLFFAALGK